MNLPAASSVLSAVDHHTAMQAAFGWEVPHRFNMAHACCVRWAMHPEFKKNAAIIVDQSSDGCQYHSYSELHEHSQALSHVLTALGVTRGDRVGIVLPQRFETAVAYMGVMHMGAVAMPLSMLFGPEALAYRLQDSAAQVAIVDAAALPAVRAAWADCPALRAVLVVGADDLQPAQPNTPKLLPWASTLAAAAAETAASTPFACVETEADEPAVLIYTSGTTGNPKGGLIPHRALIGNLSGFVCSQNFFGFDPAQGWPFACALRPASEVISALPLPVGSQAVFWSPADWAWTGGLMDALLPCLCLGRPIVAYAGRFSPEVAFTLLQRHGVTHSFLFPTALKAMMKAYPEPRRHFQFKLDGLMSAGEAVGDAVFAYGREHLGVVVNEMFGQTEVNYIVGNCCLGQVWGETGPQQPHALGWPAKPGSMGKGYPGHRVSVIDDAGHECADGVVGEVAIHALSPNGQPDPIFMLGYWRQPEATRAKFTGDPAQSWFRTGDLALRDADGYLWYQGRSDDVFKVAGYRIGPGEIENCLVKHPAVLNAAVVPKPDADRGALVKAYVVLAPDFEAKYASSKCADGSFDAQSMAPLVAQLQAHVKGQLAPYEYPKEMEFVSSLPMTTTGKVQRRVLRLQEQARAKAAAAAVAQDVLAFGTRPIT